MWWAKRHSNMVTFDTLKEVYTFPEWDLGQRAAETLNIIACIILYSGGMPILYVFGMLYCFGAYWIDKYTLLRASKRPPNYGADLISKSVEFVPLLAFLHVIFACVTMSNSTLFPSNWSSLRPLAESVFGLSLEEYQNIMRDWEGSDSTGKDAMFSDYCHARLLDFSRQSVWLLMLLFLAGCAYYILVYLYLWVFSPVLSPFMFALKQSCAKRCKCCKRLADKEVESDLTYAEAMVLVEKSGKPTTYHMKDNAKYIGAHKALERNEALVIGRKSTSKTQEHTV